MKMHGNSRYSIEYLATVVKKDIPALPNDVRTMIKNAIEQKLVNDPINFGKPLQYSLKGYRRLRVADYRIVFRIDAQNNKIIIVAIKHRKDVYCDA